MNKMHTFSNMDTHTTIAGALALVFGAIDDEEIIIDIVDDDNCHVGYLWVTYKDESNIVSVQLLQKTNLRKLFDFPKSQDSARQILDHVQKILLELV